MNAGRRSQCRNAIAAWNGNVDACGNDVGQSVTCQRCDQAKRATGRSMSNFQKILVAFRSARPLIQPSADLPDEPEVPIGIESFGRNTSGPRIGISEYRRKAGTVGGGSSGLHR